MKTKTKDIILKVLSVIGFILLWPFRSILGWLLSIPGTVLIAYLLHIFDLWSAPWHIVKFLFKMIAALF